MGSQLAAGIQGMGDIVSGAVTGRKAENAKIAMVENERNRILKLIDAASQYDPEVVSGLRGQGVSDPVEVFPPAKTRRKDIDAYYEQLVDAQGTIVGALLESPNVPSNHLDKLIAMPGWTDEQRKALQQKKVGGVAQAASDAARHTGTEAVPMGGQLSMTGQQPPPQEDAMGPHPQFRRPGDVAESPEDRSGFIAPQQGTMQPTALEPQYGDPGDVRQEDVLRESARIAPEVPASDIRGTSAFQQHEARGDVESREATQKREDRLAKAHQDRMEAEAARQAEVARRNRAAEYNRKIVVDSKNAATVLHKAERDKPGAAWDIENKEYEISKLNESLERAKNAEKECIDPRKAGELKKDRLDIEVAIEDAKREAKELEETYKEIRRRERDAESKLRAISGIPNDTPPPPAPGQGTTQPTSVGRFTVTHR
jgi:hypothetical protein